MSDTRTMTQVLIDLDAVLGKLETMWRQRQQAYLSRGRDEAACVFECCALELTQVRAALADDLTSAQHE